VTPAGKSSRTVSRRSHSDFSMPRICEQLGLLFVVPTPRDAGGTALVCVASRARFALVVSRVVSRALLAALGVFGSIVCCGMAFGAAELDVGVGVEVGVGFEAGVDADGVDEGVACGAGAEGGGDVFGCRTGACAPGGLAAPAFVAGAAG
jgi:hypothetical protein